MWTFCFACEPTYEAQIFGFHCLHVGSSSVIKKHWGFRSRSVLLAVLCVHHPCVPAQRDETFLDSFTRRLVAMCLHQHAHLRSRAGTVSNPRVHLYRYIATSACTIPL